MSSSLQGIENVFSTAAGSPGQASNLKVAGAVSDLARGNTNSGILKPNGKINQTERLLTARPRSGKVTESASSGFNPVNSRGEYAYIKLLTSQKQYSEYLNASTSRRLSHNSLVGLTGDATNMSDPTGNNSRGYDKFLITGVSCAMSEKVQISEVFGDNEVIYYFGRQPLVFNIRGVLIDSPDNDWFATWLKMYDDFLRGSQLARNYELIKIVLPNMSITGTISGFSFEQDGARDVDIPFSFQFIAKIVEPRAATNENMITSNRLASVDFSKAFSQVSQANINSLKGQVATLTKKIQDPLSSLKDRAAALSALGGGVGGNLGTFLDESKNTIKDYQKTVDGWTKSQNSYFNDVKNSSMFQTVTSSLNGIRTNLFSPVYGVLSSLTKLISNTFNSASSIFNSLITPVRNILRDITNISKQAIAIVNLVNSSIKGFGRNVIGQLKGVEKDFNTALKTVGKAAGTIASAPISVAQSISSAFTQGALANDVPFLQSSNKLAFSRPSLSISGKLPIPKYELLGSVVKYSSKTANSV